MLTRFPVTSQVHAFLLKLLELTLGVRRCSPVSVLLVVRHKSPSL